MRGGMSVGVVTSRALTSSDLGGSSHSGAKSLTRLRLSAEGQATARLTVRTSEGDTVTLSAARADLTSIAYDRTGRPATPDLSLQLTSARVDEFKAFEEVVDGELNEQERKDFDALLTNIDDVAAAFFSGRVGEAISRALQVQDLGSLQGYRFDAGYSTSTFVEQNALADLAEVPGWRCPPRIPYPRRKPSRSVLPRFSSSERHTHRSP